MAIAVLFGRLSMERGRTGRFAEAAARKRELAKEGRVKEDEREAGDGA